jgi:hypothetical protein
VLERQILVRSVLKDGLPYPAQDVCESISALDTAAHDQCDGWSLGILKRELAELYSAHVDDRPPALAEPELHNADFAQWQHSLMRGAVLGAHADYWKRMLSNSSPVLGLQTDYVRSAVLKHAGASLDFKISSTITSRVAALAPPFWDHPVHRHDVGLCGVLAPVHGQERYLHRVSGHQPRSS